MKTHSTSVVIFLSMTFTLSAQEGKPGEMVKPDWQGGYPLSVPVRKGMAAPEYGAMEVPARDGKKLVVHEWAPAKRKADTPVVIFLHGIGMHGRPHGAVAPAFSARGIVFIVPDLRGHGYSQGDREVLADPDLLRSDLGEILGQINKRHPQAPLYLAGESMGGLLAAEYAARGERRLDGLILLVPAFAVHPSQIKLDGLGKILWEGAVELASEAKLGPSTREPDFIKARLKDDKALRQVKNSYLFTLSRLQGQWPKSAEKINVPLFVGVAGKDRIIDGSASKGVFDRAATANHRKTWRQWDEACHTLCWDPLTETIMDEVAKWVLEKR